MANNTFNIRKFKDGNANKAETEIVEIKGKLIDKYGFKIILHESLESIRKNNKDKVWNLTEYYTGMTVYSGVGTIKRTLEIYETLFNNQNLTEVGRKDWENKVRENIDLNLKKYGSVNQ